MTGYFYLWLKAVHVIAVIAWMAAVLYLPRLFVYHCQAASGSQASEMLKLMERRLLRVIATPAMVASFVFGVLLLLEPGVVNWSEGWLHAKLLLVLGLAVFHGMMARWRRDFAADRNRRSRRFYRLANEVPTVLIIVIVILVVVKPF